MVEEGTPVEGEGEVPADAETIPDEAAAPVEESTIPESAEAVEPTDAEAAATPVDVEATDDVPAEAETQTEEPVIIDPEVADEVVADGTVIDGDGELAIGSLTWEDLDALRPLVEGMT